MSHSGEKSRKEDQTEGGRCRADSRPGRRNSEGNGAASVSSSLTFLAVSPFASHGAFTLVAPLRQRLALGQRVAPVGLAWVVNVSAGWTYNHTHKYTHAVEI